MLDDYHLRCLTYGDGTYVQVRWGHAALRELDAAGYPVDQYHTQAGTGLPGRPAIILVPIADWDTLAARQRGSAHAPQRWPTAQELRQDVDDGLYAEEA
jgi:hypothetical protein